MCRNIFFKVTSLLAMAVSILAFKNLMFPGNLGVTDTIFLNKTVFMHNGGL